LLKKEKNERNQLNSCICLVRHSVIDNLLHEPGSSSENKLRSTRLEAGPNTVAFYEEDSNFQIIDSGLSISPVEKHNILV
jgi:hypothetical protein